MGFAILWIVFFHMEATVPSLIEPFKHQGFGGTDIFIFLSGFGLYYSLKKDNDPMRFYKRRFEHIFPAYIPFILVSFAGMVFISIRSGEFDFFEIFQDFCGNFSFLGRANALDHQTNWYMPAILWFYIFTPLFYHLITDYTGKKRAVSISALFIFIALVNITFLRNELILIAVSRLFVFILGMLFADLKGRNISERALTVSAVAGLVISIIWIYVINRYFSDKLRAFGLGWYTYIIAAPSIVILLGRLFSLLDKNSVGRKINSFFGFIGKTSFEIYLFHMFLFPLVTSLFGDRANNIMWVIFAVIGIAGGIVYHYVIEYAKKFFKKRAAA